MPARVRGEHLVFQSGQVYARSKRENLESEASSKKQSKHIPTQEKKKSLIRRQRSSERKQEQHKVKNKWLVSYTKTKKGLEMASFTFCINRCMNKCVRWEWICMTKNMNGTGYL